MKNKSLCLFLIIFLLGCSGSGELDEMSQQVRETWGKFLQPLPKVNFEDVLGFQPDIKMVDLGRLLFNDPILSRNNDVSCGTCHLTNHGFADGQRLSFGALGKGGATGETVGRSWAQGHITVNRMCDHDGYQFYCDKPMNRNTLSTVNVAFRANHSADSGLMWDGRFGKLFHTSLLPIMSAREMCGVNPLSAKNNIFKKGGHYFKESVKVFFATPSDQFSGSDLEGFYSKTQEIWGIPSRRANGKVSKPNKTECLAIAIAKLRKNKKYQRLFTDVFGSEKINDRNLGKALASFVSTHVSRNTKFDKFVGGKNSLSKEQLLGLSMFLSPAGKSFDFFGRKLKGVGCVDCHKPPTFAGTGFFSLGVSSDPRSDRSQAKTIQSKNFSVTNVGSRGVKASCYIEGKTADSQTGYGPDIGRARVTGDSKDCFKFRVPTLRNVIETYPYFHHGNATGQSSQSNNFKERSEIALKQTIDYHLRGAVNQKQINFLLGAKKYFDEFYLKDFYVPIEFQKYTKSKDVMFPIELSSKEKIWLMKFVAYGLQDKLATRVGELGNDVSHPRSVPSGLVPTVTRDDGMQSELVD